MSRIGVFVARQWPDLASLVANPDEIKRYRDAFGLNLAFVGALPIAAGTEPPDLPFAHSTEASSVRLPAPAVQSHNPFPADRRGRAGPGARFVQDDSLLRRAIELFHRHDVECWMVTLAWAASGATLFPAGMAIDLHGRRTDALGAAMFCPVNPQVNAWFAAYLPYLIREYGADGVFFTHARYPPTIDMLWACACTRCSTLAAELGFDIERMRGGMLEFRRRLAAMPPAAVRAALSPGPVDRTQGLEPPPEVRDWFAFRAAVLGRGLAEIGRAVRAGAPGATFAVQGLFPSLAAVVGQQPGAWPAEVDQVVYMLSYVREVALRFTVAAAEFLVSSNPKLQEADALALMCRAAGWPALTDYLPGRLPELKAAISGAMAWNPWYERLVSDEIRKAAEVTKGPGVMIGLRGNSWPREAADRFRADALAQGAAGVVYQSYTLPWS